MDEFEPSQCRRYCEKHSTLGYFQKYDCRCLNYDTHGGAHRCSQCDLEIKLKPKTVFVVALECADDRFQESHVLMSIHLDEQEAKSTAQDHGDQLLPDQLAEGFFISVTEMILGSAGTVVRGWTYGATKDFCGKDACKNCEGC